jgi:hypothetical protein
VELLARIAEVRYVSKCMSENLMGKTAWEKKGVQKRIILKFILKQK